MKAPNITARLFYHTVSLRFSMYFCILIICQDVIQLFRFCVFLPLVFSLYWLFRKSIKIQNIILLLASYYFYSCWDWRFLSLIVISTIVDYSVGWSLSKEESQKKRKALLWLSIIVNLGFLGFFKYYNFFIEQFIQSFALFGVAIKAIV